MQIDWKLQKTAPAFAEIRAAKSRVIPKNLLELLFIYFGLVLLAIGASWAVQNIAAAVVRTVGSSSYVAYAISALGMAAQIAVYMAYCKLAERRSLRTLGFVRRRVLPLYLVGAAAGVLLFGGAVLIAYACGAADYQGTGTGSAGLLLMNTIYWMMQGMSEEVSCRGFFMMTAGLYVPPGRAVVYNSIIFAAGHFANNGISAPAAVNLFLFGVMSSLLFLRTGSIWCCAALHSFWNMAQGNIFGLPVSGYDAELTAWRFGLTDSSSLLTGGAFGLEGSLCVTAVLLLGTVAVYLLPQHRTGDLEENSYHGK